MAAAVAGAAIGAKLLFWLEDPRQTLANLHNPAYLTGGKSIVGALIGGLITVELMKRFSGLRISTGDLYAIPLAFGIAIGRTGCFLTGLSDNTYGTPTNLPWAISFGDGIPRHPTQLYEIAFLLLLIPILYQTLRGTHPNGGLLTKAATKQSKARTQSKDPYVKSEHQNRIVRTDNWVLLRGDVFKLFMVAYMTFRFFCDFIKPYPRLLFGLGGIQWACLLVLLYYSRDIARWLRIRRLYPQ